MSSRKKRQNDTDSAPGLRGAQQKVFRDLVAGSTISGAARNSGISRATVYRWLADDRFRTALTEARAGAVFAAKDTIKLLSENMIARLNEIAQGQDIAQSRMAATTLLGHALAIERDEAIEARIARLEALLGIKTPADEIREIAEATKGKPS